MNKKFLFKAAGTLMAAGLLFGGPPAGAADVTGAAAEGDGFVAGNAIDGNLDVPLAACGVAAVGVGVATGVCEPYGTLAWTGDDKTWAEAEGDGFIAGNAVALDADVPVAVCGVGAALIGVGTGVCHAYGPLATTGDDVTKARAKGNGTITGTAVALTADVPVAVCGVGAGVLGIAGTGVCEATGPLATTGDDVTKAEAEGNGLVAGNAVAGDLDVPVAACGVGGAGIGVGTGVCEANGPLATADDVTKAAASGNGTGTGNAVALDADVPVAACGGGIAVIGIATGVCD
jgi:hypothetical protein